MNDVKSQAASSTIWGMVEKFGVLGIQFVVSMVLARLLMPEDYGMVAMLMIFLAIAQQFVDCGFTNALIRKETITTTDYSSAFFLSLSFGIVAYLILFILAPLVGTFYGMPLLSDILRVSGLNLILSSFYIVLSAMLTRKMRFKSMAKANTSVSVVTGLLAIMLAYKGFGVWTLIFQTISSTLFLTLCYYRLTRWKPTLCLSVDSIKYLWNFGSKMLCSGIISVVYSNVYSLVIGKFYNGSVLGYFNRGQSIAQLIPNIITNVFMKTSLPIMSKIQNDKNHLISVYRKFSILVCFITFPVAMLMFALAKPFILLFLTEKWSQAIIYIQIFSLSAIISPLNFVNLNLLQALGRSDLTLKAEIIKKSIGFIVVVILLNFGPLSLAIGSSTFNVFVYFVNLYYAKKLLGLTYLSQIKDWIPYMLVSFAMVMVVMLFNSLIGNLWINLILGSFVGLLFYFFATKFFLKVEYYDYILNKFGYGKKNS